MLEVTPQLYMTLPLRTPEDLIPLADAHVTHVLNVGPVENRALIEDHGFTFLHPSFVDSGRDQEPFLWEEIYRFAQTMFQVPEWRLAVHCIGGPRRSVSALYFILRLLDVSSAGALALLALRCPNDAPIYAGGIETWLIARSAGAMPLAGS